MTSGCDAGASLCRSTARCALGVDIAALAGPALIEDGRSGKEYVLTGRPKRLRIWEVSEHVPRPIAHDHAETLARHRCSQPRTPRQSLCKCSLILGTHTRSS